MHSLSFTIIILLLATSLLPSCTTRSGAEIFQTEGCSNCHSYKGKGGSMGPDLTAVSAERSANWIQKYLKNPQATFPKTRMPAFAKLSNAERKAIAKYLAE